jgi:glutamate-1-semialdehyde aminotransferase
MGKGQEIYKKAKKIIPGGNMLLSKRPEMFLPDIWPAYFSKAKGYFVWDLDGNKYIDMSTMGVGTNSLGYCNSEIDNAVLGAIKKSNLSTLNCVEEVFLAEKMIEINQWADQVKFARTGGEANALAIRIARAASNKDNIAICGYHGWHDWYLSVNHTENDGLSDHLLPGLKPKGVPKKLKGTVFPFEYNDFEGLKRLVMTKNIGVIKMEVIRNFKPKNDFLNKVRELANLKNIVLIFDECTSGFRENFGGIHLKYGVEPDIAVFGKTLGNGYAITAIVGRRQVMELAQKTFISSTFWTERIGPTAALKTLEVMKRLKSWEKITFLGKKVQQGWIETAKKNDISITTNGIPALSTFSFNHEDALKYKTFLSQEFLKRGYLASTGFYASFSHNEKIINSYFNVLDEIFFKISEFVRDKKSVDESLDGKVAHNGFKRLN